MSRSLGGDEKNTPFFQSALDTLPLNIALLDTDGTILQTNEAWREFGTENGISVGPDTIGLNYLDVCDRADDPTAEEVAAGIREVLAGTRSVFESEYPCHSPDEKRWFLFRATLFTHAETHYVSVSHLDITDRKRAEQDVKRTADRLADERETLALLNRIVRHDVRNDANVIAGWANLLSESVPSEHREELRRIAETTTQMAELTHTAAELSETFVDDPDELRAMNLTDVLDFQLDKLRGVSSIHSKAVIVDDEAVPDTDVWVLGDEMVAAVFSNILNNAVFHTHTEPVEITVTADRESSADTVVVRIADNGPGIPDAAKESVFGRGERGLASDGTGLGLYLVDKLMSRYGGSVALTDNEPMGTVVTVQFRETTANYSGDDTVALCRDSSHAN